MKRVVVMMMLTGIVACGSGKTASSGAAGSGPPTVTSLASTIGCTALDQSGQTELYTRENGLCDLDATGETTVIIYTFTSEDQKRLWVDRREVARQRNHGRRRSVDCHRGHADRR